MIPAVMQGGSVHDVSIEHFPASEIQITAQAVDAVARRLYGDKEYDALPEGQAKEAYRKQARALLQLANDANKAG